MALTRCPICNGLGGHLAGCSQSEKGFQSEHATPADDRTAVESPTRLVERIPSARHKPGTCSFCGTVLTAFNRGIGATACSMCVDGESVLKKAGKTYARIFGGFIFLAGIVGCLGNPLIGVVGIAVGAWLLYLGCKAPKLVPGSKAYKRMAQMHYAWFESISDCSEERICQIPISASSGLRVSGMLVAYAATFAGGFVNFAVSGLCCAIALLILGPIFARANPLDQVRWKRFWHGIVLGYWVTYAAVIAIAVFGLKVLERQLPDTLIVAFFSACLVGAVVGFTNVAFRDKRDKDAIIRHLAERGKPSGKQGTDYTR